MTKIAVVTGATSGLGEAAAIALANEGWRVVVVGRDEARGREVLAKLGERGELELVDFFSLAALRALGDRLVARHPTIDLVIHNAGGAFQKDERTRDGLERTFALNVAAPFVLTQRLLPALERAKGRVVNVVTGLPKGQRASLDELVGAKAGPGFGSYSRAKLALLALTIEQEERLAARGVTFVALHPGIIPTTRFGHELPAFFRTLGPIAARVFRFGSTLDQAADRYLRVSRDPVEGGGYYWEGVRRDPPPFARDAAFRSALWSELERRA